MVVGARGKGNEGNVESREREWDGGPENHEREPVCSCALCAHERGDPSEAYWRAAERALLENPDPPEMVNWAMCLTHILHDYSNAKSEVVRDQLIDMFRGGSKWRGDLPELLADMLDPAGKTSWRLELRRRHRGHPGRLSDIERYHLCLEYEWRLIELRYEKRASPAKTARGELAARYKMTDEEIRSIIKREEGKRGRKRRKG